MSEEIRDFVLDPIHLKYAAKILVYAAWEGMFKAVHMEDKLVKYQEEIDDLRKQLEDKYPDEFKIVKR